MWKKIKNSIYFLHFNKEDKYKIYITNYFTLWHGFYTETTFVDCLKESNTDLQLKDDILRDKGIQMLTNPDDLKKTEINIDGSTMVVFVSMSFGYTINLNVKLTESSKEMFFQKVTQPLLRAIQSMQSKDSDLQQLIMKKDREIAEYKLEGIKIARHFKTPKFEENDHKMKYNVFEQNFGSLEILNGLLEKEVSLPEEREIKCEPVQVKSEMDVSTLGIKVEPESPMETTFSSAVTVKREVKSEPGIGDIRKKRRAKLNL